MNSNGTRTAYILLAAFASVLIAAGTALSRPGEGQVGFVKVALGEGEAAAGIKQALMTSTVEAVNLTGRRNGYFGNPAIRIGLPQSLQPLERGLKAVGLGPKLDQFELSMNRAAEAAAPLAKPIFEKAITSMTLTDAQRIVSGGGQSATNYFKAKTSRELTIAFTPVIKKAMAKYSVTRQYETLMGASQHSMLGLGGMSSLMGHNVDIDHYVVQKSLDGLFYMIGQEERKIRTNPAAQVTPLLRQVFGRGR